MAIRLYVRLAKSREEIRVLGHQFLRSATSVAAHAREASRARSDAEFCAKIDALTQEADESQLWLEYLEEECHVATQDMRREADELIAIFTAISTITKKRATETTAK